MNDFLQLSSSICSRRRARKVAGGEDGEWEWVDFDLLHDVLKAIDLVTICYFFLEYAVRFTCSPVKAKFFFQVNN